MLDAFQHSLSEKVDFTKRTSSSFAKEFKSDRSTKRKLSQKFRSYRQAITDILTESDNLDSIWEDLFQGLSQFKLQLQPLSEQIKLLAAQDKLEPDFEGLIWSLVHMQVNRLSRSKARKNELVLHYMLAQHYASQLAQKQVKQLQLG